jgi:hypothetical protein
VLPKEAIPVRKMVGRFKHERESVECISWNFATLCIMQSITSASRQGTRGWGSHGPPAALQPRARLAWPTLLSSRTHRMLARVELAAALGSMMEGTMSSWCLFAIIAWT